MTRSYKLGVNKSQFAALWGTPICRDTHIHTHTHTVD